MSSPHRPRLLLRWRLWLLARTRLRRLEATLLWAGLVGLVGGLVGVLFREALQLLHWLFTQYDGDIVETARALPLWQRVLVPVGGALLAGLVAHYGMRLTRRARAASTTDFMEAIAIGDGVLGVRANLVRSASSLMTLASGGSTGREGPMVQLSALGGSLIGRGAQVSGPELRLLVACGAAAGIAAAYNAPIAGALFVAEIVLGSIAMQSFGPLIFASVVATLVSRYALGGQPLFEVPSFTLVSPWELPLYVFLGIGAGVAAPWFLASLRIAERVLSKLPGPIFVRLAAGGIVVGALSMYTPEVWGNGYTAVGQILRSAYVWDALLVLFVLKVVATAATVGSGAFGGVFTPTLFVGATLGCLYGQLLNALFPGAVGPPHAYAIIGMGCLLAGTTHAPLMAILMLFEMTLTYEIVLPLMLACVTAYYAAHRIDPRSVYNASLERRRLAQGAAPVTTLRVLDLMRPSPPRVRPDTSFEDIADAFSGAAEPELFVVSDEGRLFGVITAADIRPYLDDASLANVVIAGDLCRRDVPALRPSSSLHEAMERLRGHDGRTLPVCDDDEHLIGTISTADVLLTLAHGAPPQPT